MSAEDVLSNLAADLLSIILGLLIAWVLIRFFPHGSGYRSAKHEFEGDTKVIWVQYPSIYRKVPFGIFVFVSVLVIYATIVRTSLPVVQARPVQEEALTAVLLFLLLDLVWVWSTFLWIYSGLYRLTDFGFQWMAPWSRKRFVRWDEVKNIWHAGWLGKGIWIKTTKGRFRIDMDMVNANDFLARAKEFAKEATVASKDGFLVAPSGEPFIDYQEPNSNSSDKSDGKQQEEEQQ